MKDPGAGGLRARKRAATRRSIQDQALRLFTERGYAATTVAMVAGAAGISPATCFRYFPTKEAMVLGDEYDGLIVASVAATPPGLSVAKRIELGVTAALAQLSPAQQAAILARVQLVQGTPQLRAHLWEQQAATLDLLAGALGPHGATPDLPARVAVAACLSTMTVAIERWAAHPAAGGLAEVMRAAFQALGDATRPDPGDGRPPSGPD